MELENLLKFLFELKNEYKGTEIDKVKLNKIIGELREKYKENKKNIY